MSKYGIETIEDLYADREKLQGEMDKLTTYRTKLQNKIRRASPAEKETLRRGKVRRYRENNRTQKAIETEQRHRGTVGKNSRKNGSSLCQREYRAKRRNAAEKITKKGA